MIDLFDNSKFKTFVLEEKHKINDETIDELAN